MSKDATPRDKRTVEQIQLKQSLGGVLQKDCSETFHKIVMTTLMMDSFLVKL